MNDGRDGRIITFYSYKGGVGRTMALANVAWILAANGHRVLASDWDLETPGLHRYFHPFLPPASIGSTTGLIDLFADFAEQARSGEEPEEDLYRRHVRVRPHAVSVDWAFPGGGALDFLSAGRQNRDFLATLASFDWDDLDERFLDALRRDLRRHYDYVLIDSRTGLGNAVEICTRDLPDVLVSCFTLNGQSLDGAAQTAHYIDQNAPGRGIRILPVAMRINDRKATAPALAAGRKLARSRFNGLPRGLSDAAAERYWADTQIPNREGYEYEEILATFGDPAGLPDSLLAAYERLTHAVTDGLVGPLPPLDETLRRYHLGSFVRSLSPDATPLVLSCVPQDRMWADWVGWVLTQSGFLVLPPVFAADTDAGTGAPPRTVALVSPAYLRSPQARSLREPTVGAGADDGPRPAEPVLLRAEEVQLTAPFSEYPVVELAGLDEASARAAVLRAVGGAAGEPKPGVPGPSFPHDVPAVWSAPARNPDFVGRDALLDRVHATLGVSRTVAVLAGPGHGAGRRYLATEYAHRFRADYDLVWWVPAATRHLAVSALARLARRLELPAGDGIEAAAQRVLTALTSLDSGLGSGLDSAAVPRRWLLVYDDAGAPGELAGLLPAGPGRVLITTRDPAWQDDRMDTLSLQATTRNESVELLRGRAPGLSRTEADQLAEYLGDLPLALHQAGVWLAATGTPARTYLQALDTMARNGEAGRPEQSPTAQPTRVAAAALRKASPAAYRLLQLCACLAPLPLPLDVVQGPAMLRALRPFDPSLHDPLQLGPLVRELSRFGLAGADQPGQVLRMPGLVQHLVRAELPAQELDAVRHDLHLVLSAAGPGQGTPDDWPGWAEFEQLWPHLDQSRAESCTDEATRAVLIERVRRTAQLGSPEAALELARRLDRAWTADAGPAAGPVAARAANAAVDPAAGAGWQTLALRRQSAAVLRQLDRYQEAHDLDLDTLARQQALLPAADPHILLGRAALSADLRMLGRFEAALDSARTTYQGFRDSFGPEHPQSLSAADALAVSLRLTGEYTAARDLHQATLASQTDALGAGHRSTLATRLGLARDLRETGDHRRAAELLDTDRGGWSDPDSAEALLAALGRSVALRRLGRYDQARSLLAAAYRRFPVPRPGAAPGRTGCAAALAGALCGAPDDPGRTVDLVAEVLRQHEALLGPQNPDTLALVHNLAVCLRASGEREAAHHEAERAVGGFLHALGDTHPSTLCARLTLINALADLGRFGEAVELGYACLKSLRERLGREHPDTALCRSNLAAVLSASGRGEAGDRLRREAVVTFSRLWGDSHAWTVRARAGQCTDRDLEPQLI
ncbi:FxSxx-COOH system tetratricopeptide repeat protein [Streptacidiphilus sp. N1-3]|uniref:FxSxx-COOH system tetratricopeptide repeat protein n=1 Tax=Streptacidiphilus alkalitolerans TaxID=3342712 RepID=A0ABV6WTB9_9ACTN